MTCRIECGAGLTHGTAPDLSSFSRLIDLYNANEQCLAQYTQCAIEDQMPYCLNDFIPNC